MYDKIITPKEGETYHEYVERLSKGRNFRKDNRPTNIYTEGHHIIPKCCGGNDVKSNLIIVLPEEHYYCHKLLALENPDNPSLQYAWWMLCHKEDKNSDTKRTYDVPPEEYAEAQRRAAKEIQKMNSIPVVEFITGVVYQSAEEAARQLNILVPSNITSCCKGKAKSANGYKFCYLSDYEKGNYENKTIGKSKRIIDLNTGKVYESSVEAAKELGLSKVNIREVCRGIRKTVGGHTFAYYEDYLLGNTKIRKAGHYRPVQDVASGIVYNTAGQAGRELDIDPSSILKVCKGQKESAKGHKFIFYLEENN